MGGTYYHEKAIRYTSFVQNVTLLNTNFPLSICIFNQKTDQPYKDY